MPIRKPNELQVIYRDTVNPKLLEESNRQYNALSTWYAQEIADGRGDRLYTSSEIPFDKVSWNANNNQSTLDGMIEATEKGLGGAYSLISIQETSKYYLGLTVDGVTLSETLRDSATTASRIATDTINTHIKNKTTWQRLTRDLTSGNVSQGDLPRYLLDLKEQAVKVGGGANPRELRRLINNANRNINKLSDKASRQQMKRAYQSVVNAVERGDVATMNKALDRAMNQKAIYNNQRIARTELQRANSKAFKRQVLDHPEYSNGNVYVRISLSSGHNVTDVCDAVTGCDCHNLGNGIYPVDDAPLVPLHPNCVIGNTAIRTHSRMNKLFNSVYTGQVVKICLSDGTDVTVTANHPVLTQRGWVKAISIRDTDYLVSDEFWGNDILTTSAPNNYTGNSTAYEISKSLMMSNEVITGTVPTSPEDFHGDAKFFDKDVDIINTDSLLVDDAISTVDKASADCDFQLRDVVWTSLDTDSSILKISNTPFRTSDSTMCFGGDFGEKLISTIFSKPFFSSFLGTLNTNPVFDEIFSNTLPSNPVFFKKSVNGFTSFVFPNDFFPNFVDVSSGLSFVLGGHSFTLDDIVHCGGMDTDSSGNLPLTQPLITEFKNVSSVLTCHVDNLPVFNFETDTTNIYSGNGYVLHNCLCLYQLIVDYDGKSNVMNSQQFAQDQMNSYLDTRSDIARKRIEQSIDNTTLRSLTALPRDQVSKKALD